MQAQADSGSDPACQIQPTDYFNQFSRYSVLPLCLHTEYALLVSTQAGSAQTEAQGKSVSAAAPAERACKG